MFNIPPFTSSPTPKLPPTNFTFKRNYDHLQESLWMETHEILTPGKEIEIDSQVYSVDLFKVGLDSSDQHKSNDEKIKYISFGKPSNSDGTEAINNNSIGSFSSSESIKEMELKKRRMSPVENLQVKSSSTPGKEWIQNVDHLFLVDHLLHQEECAELLMKEEVIGFESISSEYPVEYRNSKRILFNDKQLAAKLWRRLKKYMVDCNFMKPYGLNTDGNWIPIGVNECMRLSKYEPGNYFKPHTDGQYVRNDDERSIYTLLIYLNDGFKGGETKFMRLIDQSLDKNVAKFKNLCEIQPKMGSASLFNHDLYHQGCLVTEGVKYILRTEIMFKRIDSTEQLIQKQDNDELYNKVLDLFHESDKAEKEGHTQKATKDYLSAQSLLIQHGHSTAMLMQPKFLSKIQQNRVINNFSMKSSISQLPDEIIFNICHFLKDSEICKLILPLDRYFNYIGRNAQLWEWMYMKKWGHSITNLLKQYHARSAEEVRNANSQDNTSSLAETPSEEQDWFHIYIMKRYFEKEFEPVCVDLSSSQYSFTYFATINGEIERVHPKVIRAATRHSSMIARFNSFMLPKESMDSRYSALEKPIYNYRGKEFTIFVQPFVNLLYKQLQRSCQRNPIIISLESVEHVFSEKKNLLLDFMFRIKIPAVCLVPRCYLLAIYYNLTTCIVLDISQNIVHAHAIIQNNKEQIKTVSETVIYKRNTSTPTAKVDFKEPITKALDSLLNQFSEDLNVKSQLMENIILSGVIMENSYNFNPRVIGEGPRSKERDLDREEISSVFSSSQYKIKYQTTGEEAIKGAQQFSKIPDLKDFFTYRFDCQDLVNTTDEFK